MNKDKFVSMQKLFGFAESKQGLAVQQAFQTLEDAIFELVKSKGAQDEDQLEDAWDQLAIEGNYETYLRMHLDRAYDRLLRN
jgi:hypothetical protein